VGDAPDPDRILSAPAYLKGCKLFVERQMGPFRGQGGLHNSYKAEVKSRDPNGSWNRTPRIVPLVLLIAWTSIPT
jgi:hypothetical protein